VVPNVKRKTLLAARKAIVKRRCRVGKVKRAYSRVKKGRVIAQTPRAGRLLARGARVNLVVSRGARR
jgi:beta-lactam-binding protein with PASTA domain